MSTTFRSYSLFALQLLVVFGAYFFTARWGLGLDAINDFATLIWPPTGIALAAAYILGYRIAPAIAIAAFAANYLSGAPLLAAAAIAAGNTAEALVGAWLLRNFRFNPRFSHLVDSFIFIMVAISATIISATVGTTALGLTTLLSASGVPITWLAWWVGDTISALVIAPFLIRWLAIPIRESRQSLKRFLETTAFLIVLAMYSVLAFWEPIPELRGIIHPYMAFIPLTWGALRVGPRAVTAGIAVVAGVAVAGTLMGTGPFAPMETARELFLLELFLSTVAFIFLLFVAAVEERKDATKQLSANVAALKEDVEEISAADQAKNDFIATLSHELRNPLAPILSALEIIHAGRVQPAEMRQLLEMTRENVMRMARLLDDLLDIARISRKKFSLQKSLISLGDVIEHAKTMADPLMKKHRHSFTVHLPHDDIKIDADQLRIEQVVVNLLTNAAKYTPPGGTISLQATAERDGAVIRVRDNGVGIPSRELLKIFEPFKQLNGNKRAESAGLGIGLSLAKRLVELHGGTIEAESSGPGHGSEFVVWLPSAKPVILLSAAAEKRPPKIETESRLGAPERAPKKKILIVDDNVDAATGIVRLLNGSGHEATGAHSGAEAFARLADFRPDIIFLDIGLPGENGFEIAKTIRSYLDPCPRIVALTGYGQEEDRERARDAGFDDFLTKPVSIAELEKALLKVA